MGLRLLSRSTMSNTGITIAIILGIVFALAVLAS